MNKEGIAEYNKATFITTDNHEIHKHKTHVVNLAPRLSKKEKLATGFGERFKLRQWSWRFLDVQRR